MDEEKIKYVLRNTQVLRLPKRKIATFGTTDVDYYLLTELVENVVEIRRGRVVAERPRIISPSNYGNLEGFGKYQDSETFLAFFRKYMRGLYYSFRFKNETEEIDTVYSSLKKVMNRVFEIVDEEDKPTGVIKGVDTDTWAISLMKFLKQTVESSLDTNIAELEERGLFEKAGYERIPFKRYEEVPLELRREVDELFKQVERGDLKTKELEKKLIKLGVYHIYIDKLLELMKRQNT